MVARTRGRVLKGGIPDKNIAARSVIKDWNKGKIPYFSVPPSDNENMAVDASAAETAVGTVKVVSQFSEEFDVNKILEAHDKEVMEGLKDVDEMDFVRMESNPQSEGKGDISGRVLDFL